MKHILITVSLPVFLLASCSTSNTTVQAKERTITVTGSSDMKLCPDRMTLTIQITEYYAEQYQGLDPKDYKTLVPLDNIEKPLMALLKKNGVEDSCIRTGYVNTSWSWYNNDNTVRPVLLQKSLTVSLTDFKKAIAIVQSVDKRGISYMTLGDFKSSNEQEMRKTVKQNALKAAKDKAGYLVSALGKSLGDVVSIKEVNDDYANGWGWSNSNLSSNSISSNYRGSASAGDPNDINLRYEIEAEFEIK